MKKTAGFTLIELLIVIALLGALAIGLLATIDPFEQLKKGRDSATRNTVTEFYNANLRFYGTKGEFPWGTDVLTMPATTLGAPDMTDAIQQLMSAGELKTNFTTVAGTNRLGRVWVEGTAADDLSVCFQPESKNFRLDQNTIYSSNGVTAGTNVCVANTADGDTDCWWCIH